MAREARPLCTDGFGLDVEAVYRDRGLVLASCPYTGHAVFLEADIDDDPEYDADMSLPPPEDPLAWDYPWSAPHRRH